MGAHAIGDARAAPAELDQEDRSFRRDNIAQPRESEEGRVRELCVLRVSETLDNFLFLYVPLGAKDARSKVSEDFLQVPARLF